MAQLNLLFAVLLAFWAAPLSSQNFNRPVPPLVPPYEFIQNDSTDHGYYLTAPFRLGASLADSVNHPKPAMILDANGYLLWYMPVYAQNLLDFKYHPDQNVFSLIRYQNPQDIRFLLMNADFQFIENFTTTHGVAPDLHEFQITADQTYLLSGVRDSIMDLSGYLFNGVPGSSQTNVIGFVAQEFDADHNLLFQWNSNDHIHPTQAYQQYGYSAANFDYCHGNSIFEDSDGGLLLSFRNLNAVYKIDRNTGQVAWKLGGKSSSFTFANDAGFSGQHDAQRLPNGNISLFDNANMAATPKVSRAVEYHLDTVNWVATKVWEYTYSPGFLSSAMGNCQTTGERLHLVNYGFNFRPDPSFVLTDDSGNLLTALIFQDTFMSYRSFLFDLPLDQLPRPSLTCSQDGANATLSAPPGFDRYAWSTGEMGTEITVQQPGIYQVWVSHGAGMLGSKPFVINDIAKACPVSETHTPPSHENRKIIGYYDLLGRRVSRPVVGELYVVVYGDGRGRVRVE